MHDISLTESIMSEIMSSIIDVYNGDYNLSRKAEPNPQEDLDGPITRA
jgi:hypothetical protein